MKQEQQLTHVSQALTRIELSKPGYNCPTYDPTILTLKYMSNRNACIYTTEALLIIAKDRRNPISIYWKRMWYIHHKTTTKNNKLYQHNIDESQKHSIEKKVRH